MSIIVHLDTITEGLKIREEKSILNLRNLLIISNNAWLGITYNWVLL